MRRLPPVSTLFPLHDALPICIPDRSSAQEEPRDVPLPQAFGAQDRGPNGRSEEHTSELQSLRQLVCRLLLEKKKTRRPPCSSTSASETTDRTTGRPPRPTSPA